MASPDASAAPADEPGAWIPLDEAAQALRLSQQTLWSRLQELGIDVRRLERDGRTVSALSRADLARLAAPNAAVRPAPPTVAPQPLGARVSEPAPRAPAVESDSGPRSLWQQLRELESQRDRLDFELRIVRVQLGDTRSRAQHAEESARLLRDDLAQSREQVEAWRARFEPLQAQLARDATMLELERDRRASVERQLAMLIEIEEARERYCDRLEQRLNAPLRWRRGA